MSQVTDDQLRQQAARDKLEDQAAALALATANPGPLRDVFAAQQDIAVGKYRVRPFYDVDFEFLQELEHPFAACAVGNTEEIESFVPRGPKAWQLFWLLTVPVGDIDATFKTGGVKEVNERAKLEFGHYQLGAQFKLFEACVRQLSIYASSVVGYGAASSGTDAKEASSKVPPP